MLPRNFAVILLVAIVSFFCHLKNRQTRPALFVGDALNMIDAYYVDPVDAETLLQSALTGMTNTLDEHSSSIPGEAFQTFQDSINQEFAGIGIIVEPSDQGKPVRVVTPLVGSPALAAGLMPGDLIVRVDGSDVSTLEITEVNTRLKGPVGTTVHLVVLRREKEVAIDITRATIALEVTNTGDRPIQVGSHYHFYETNPALAFDREAARGFRLDIAPGTAVRCEPGQAREVVLVALAAVAPPGRQSRSSPTATMPSRRRWRVEARVISRTGSASWPCRARRA